MSEQPPFLPHYSPGISSLLPLFYIAWADRLLTPSEALFLQQRVQELEFLNPEEKALIEKWSDPKNPPNRELFHHWKILLKDVARSNAEPTRQTLVDLGLQLAQYSASIEQGHWSNNTATRQALENLEEALGAINIDTYLSIFPQAEAPAQKPSFDLPAMTALLDGDYAHTRNHLRSLLQDPIFQAAKPPLKEAYRTQVLEWLHLLAQQGYGALSYPEVAGGKKDMGQYAVVFEMLGYHDLSLTIKFGVQFGLFGGSIDSLGTEYHQRKYLPAVGDLSLPGCFAMTETGHGSNVRGLETTATYQPDQQTFLIHTPHEGAGKEYIGNALHGRMATVFAQLIVDGENHGVHAILVPLRDEDHRLLPGIRIEDNGYKLGLNGVDNGRIWFTEVEVPRENLLNRFGEVSPEGVYSSPIENPSRRFFTMLGTLVGGRVCVPRAGLSAAKKGLTIAIKYALRRRQFAPDFKSPETLLLDYPSHQRRLMPLLAQSYAVHFGLAYLTERYLHRTEDDIREIETLAAGMKAYATWFTTACLQECREACGGKGYLSENQFADLKADTDIFTTFEGDNTVLMQLVAKGLLSAFRQEFHEEGVMGILRLLTTRVTTAITELNPIVIRSTEVAHLLDPKFHLSAFHYREERLLHAVAQRMRRLIKDGVNSYDAALQCQTHFITLAKAFIERVTLEQFQQQVEAQKGSDLYAPLLELQQLFALHTLESHKGWYLEAGYMEAVKTKAIRRMVDKLCLDVRQKAAALVDAFAIPGELLKAPIAHQQIQ